MVPLEVLGVTIYGASHPLVILRHEDRFLPIVVGTAEADAIHAALEKRDLGRPMTHDLICNLMAGLGGDLKSVIVYKLENETFYAHLNIEQSNAEGGVAQVLRVDSRPSDGIAIACRLNAPIFAAQEVMDQASQDMALLSQDTEDDDESDGEGEDESEGEFDLG